MLQELLAQIEREVALSKAEMNDLKSTVSTTAKTISEKAQIISPKKKPEVFHPTYDLTMSHVIKQSPSISFSKSQRFKDSKPDFTGNAGPVPDILSAAIATPAKLPHQKNQANVVFTQAERFPEEKRNDFRDAFYDVNYAPIVRKAQAAVINPPKQKAKFSDNASTISYGSVASDLETQASMSSFIGPGAYDVKYNAVEPMKGFALPKSRRFVEQKSTLTNVLNPNYDAIKRKAPGVVIRNAVPVNEKLQMKQEQEEFIQLEAAMNERLRPVDAFKVVKPNAGAAVIRKRIYDVTAAPKNSREKIAAVFRFLDQLREIGGRGPAEYSIPEPEAAPTMVVYRKSSYSPVRKDPKEDIPGPDYYYCKDDLIKEKKPNWTFAKEPKEKPFSVEDYDARDYNVNIEAIRPNPTAAVILPEHLPKFIGEEGMLELQRGPGAYEPNFEQTEKRTDIGVIKIAPMNENNKRENNMAHLEAFERFDNDLIFPSVDPIKPNNQRGFKYHEPADIKPDHVPDKDLFPEKWEFYDYDMNEIKENMKKGGDFSSKMSKDIFAEHEEFMRIMKDYYAQQNRVPHVGEYDVNYKQQDRHVPGVDIEKMQEKDIDPIVKPDGDVDGDNLILEDPSRPSKRLPDIKFNKMLGRPEEDRDNDTYEDVLQIDVNLAPTKPKVPVLVDMKRQSERDDVFAPKQQRGGADEEIDVQVNYKQIDKKVKGYVEIQKISNREEDPYYAPKSKEQEVVLDVKTDIVKPKKSTSVNIGKAARRFPPPLPKKK